MEPHEIGDLDQSKSTDRNVEVNRMHQRKNVQEPAENVPSRSDSTIQKSQAEALVLSYAAGLPVLQPPPKTHVKGSHHASSFAIGGSAQVGGVTTPIEAYTSTPIHHDPMDVEEVGAKESRLDIDFIVKYAKSLLDLTTQPLEKTDQDTLSKDQSLKLMLSAMALAMLYRSVYDGVTGEEFVSLFEETVKMPEQIKPLFDQFVAHVKANLPDGSKERAEALEKLAQLVDRHHSMASILQMTRHLSQVLVKGDLAAPQGVDAFVESMLPTKDTKETMIGSIFKTYNKNLLEFSDRMQAPDIQSWIQEVALKGAKSSNESYAYILAAAVSQTKDGQNALINQFNQAFSQWIVKPNKELTLIASGDAWGNYPSSSFVAGCMMCGVDLVQEATKSATGNFEQNLTENPIADVLVGAVASSTLPLDFQAAAALIASLLNNGMIYKATQDALKEKNNKGSPPRDLDFAISYAKHVISIVSRKPSALSQPNQHIQERDRLIRLMLSVMGLNLLYRVAYGGMTGEEFGSILKGVTADIIERIRGYIEALARLVKDNLPPNETFSAKVILTLMDYVDSKDSIEAMLKSTRMLTALMSTKDVDQRRFESESG